VTHRRIGPISRYLLAVVAISAALGAIWWSGAVSPRAGLEWSGQGLATQGRATWEARELVNPGPLPVDVRAVDWSALGIEDAQVRLSDQPASDVPAAIAASEPFTPLTLGPGERTTIVLAGFAACPPGATESRPASLSLSVTLAPPAGPVTTRTERLSGSDGAGPSVRCS
jgi:hypothetical protein